MEMHRFVWISEKDRIFEWQALLKTQHPTMRDWSNIKWKAESLFSLLNPKFTGEGGLKKFNLGHKFHYKANSNWIIKTSEQLIQEEKIEYPFSINTWWKNKPSQTLADTQKIQNAKQMLIQLVQGERKWFHASS